LGCHLLSFVLSFGELNSRGAKARRIFRQLERLVRTQTVKSLINISRYNA
jgi:hypothetical protein